MPDRADDLIVQDAEVLRAWMRSEYFAAFQRLLDDALEDRRNAVLGAPVKSQDDFYAVLEAKGRWIGLNEVMGLVTQRISQGERVRERLMRL